MSDLTVVEPKESEFEWHWTKPGIKPDLN